MDSTCVLENKLEKNDKNLLFLLENMATFRIQKYLKMLVSDMQRFPNSQAIDYSEDFFAINQSKDKNQSAEAIYRIEMRRTGGVTPP